MKTHLVIAVALAAILAAPSLACAVNVTTNVKNGQEVATGNITLQTSDGKTTTVKNGETVDVPTGSRVTITHSGMDYWSREKTIIADRDQTVDLQAREKLPTALWAPPAGVLTFGAVEQNFWVGDMKKNTDIFTDRTTVGDFVARNDARQNQQDNNDNANRFSLGFSGLFANGGLPVFSLGNCECWFFTHALGFAAGNGHTDLHIHDRQDNRASNARLSGDGFAYGGEYTATATVRPGSGLISHFGHRINLAALTGKSDGGSLAPKGLLAAGGATAIGNATEASANWTVLRAGFDVLFRPASPSLYTFVGVEWRQVTADVNISTPVVVPGFGNVQRDIHQRYTNTNVLPRFGVEGMVPPGLLPAWMPPIFARGEGTLGPGGSGFMIKVGTGFDIVGAVKGR